MLRLFTVAKESSENTAIEGNLPIKRILRTSFYYAQKYQNIMKGTVLSAPSHLKPEVSTYVKHRFVIHIHLPLLSNLCSGIWLEKKCSFTSTSGAPRYGIWYQSQQPRNSYKETKTIYHSQQENPGKYSSRFPRNPVVGKA